MALSLMFRYSEQVHFCFRMLHLAREKLRHYEQVFKIIQQPKLTLILLKPSRYATALMLHVSKDEPQPCPSC